uniref:Keratin n=1 Tax=Chelydra serpentina TaxID=8475 RepID=A0A8C3TGF0_CHESE
MSSCKDLCYRPSSCYPDICPDPCVVARNEPCITSCGGSTAVVYPPPVSVLFPGPTLSTYPQHTESVVGSSAPFGIGSSLGVGGPYGSRSLGKNTLCEMYHL